MISDKYGLEPTVKILFADLDISLPNVLRRAALPGDLLAHGRVRLSEDDYFSFWNALDDEAADPSLPVRIAEVISPEVFDVALFAALSSPDLATATQRIATHKRLLSPIRLDVTNNDRGLTIEYRWPSDTHPPRPLAMTELLFWVALARMGTRHRVEPVSIQLPEVPTADPRLRGYLGAATIEDASKQSVTFNAFDACRPFLTVNDAVWDTFEPDLRRRLDELDANNTTADRVRAALLEMLPAGESAMRAVAKRLAVSSRTLHRRLQDEDTNYQSILNATREGLARHYLSRRDISVGEISFLLGYEEPSSFYRAFHQWTGQTPERIRIGVA